MLLLVGRKEIGDILQSSVLVSLEFVFQGDQLAHEVEVWRDGGALVLHQLVGGLHGEAKVRHEVGDGEGDRAGDTGHAVD